MEYPPSPKFTYICCRCDSPAAKRKRALAAKAATPLEERDPELYKRLDELSRLPLEGNGAVWNEFVLEIGAGQLYEHLPMLVALLREGNWRSALNPQAWLSKAWRNQARKCGSEDDYDRTGKRRPGGPKFDKRNGALLRIAIRPYAEFEMSNTEGERLSGEEVIDAAVAMKQTLRVSNYFHVPVADRESLKFLHGRTWAEAYEGQECERALNALQQDRPAFNEALARIIRQQRPLAERVELDSDEAEVLAVITLLWAAEPRTYLNFLDETNRKRIRNAWDRLDRRRKKQEWASLFRQALRGGARDQRIRRWAEDGLRKFPERGYHEIDDTEYDLPFWDDRFQAAPPPKPKIDHVEQSSLPLPVRIGSGMPANWSRMGPLLKRLTHLGANGGEVLLPPPRYSSGNDANEGSRVVDIGFDLDSKQRALYISSATKPKPQRKGALYSE